MFNRTAKLVSYFLLLASFAAHATDAVGELAPDFVRPSLADGNQRLSEYRGQVVIMTLWSPGCLPCRDAIRLNQTLQSEYRLNGAVSLAVALTPSREFAARFVERHAVGFPMLLDTQATLAEAYSVTTSTKTVVVDQQGMIIFAAEGYAAEHAEAIRNLFTDRLGWPALERK